MGIQPLAGPFPLTKPSELQHLAVWREPLPATSSPRRPQPRPRPRGKAPAGMSLGRRRGMSGPSPRSLPLGGAVPPETRKVWARLARGRGLAGSCPWPVGPLSTTGPLPLEDLPGCLQRPLCKHSRRLFPPAAHNAPKPGRKALRGGALSRPLPLSLGARQGVHTPRPRQNHMHTSVPAPCTGRELGGARVCQAAAGLAARVGRGRADLGAHWASCSPCCPEAAGPKRSWASSPLLVPSL